MKRILLVLALLLSVFAGCIKENPAQDPVSGDNLPFPEGERGLIRMSVVLPGADTKAMADLPQITSLRVVIFGSSGFLKESIDAENLVPATINGNSTLYTFDVKPSLTDSKNLRVHIIANCSALFPWKYEDVVMSGSAYTQNGQDAYWARFTLPNGITPKKEYSTTTEAMEYVKVGDFYQVTDDITTAFTGIPLIRNFAKFTVESVTPQLVLNSSTTLALINVPDRGSVAPYDPTRSLFMDHYKDSSYTELKASYPGFSPADTRYLNTNPDAVTFHSASEGVYMYERPAPTNAGDVATYLIIHGTYYPLKDGKNASDLAAAVAAGTQTALNNVLNYNNGQDGYYKIDLMDEDGYYAVLRNFRYNIRISGVSKAGAATPGQAGSTGGGGDISSSNETAALTDISDGYGRIAVSFVERTFVDQQAQVELKYKFIPSVDSGDNPDNRLTSEGTEQDPGPVTITIDATSGPVSVISSTFGTTVSGESGVVVDGGTKGKIKVLSTLEDNEGYRTIHFTTNTPSSQGRSVQKIRITGRIDEFKTIYRDITFNLMEKQNMTVSCEADERDLNQAVNAVEDIAGQGVNVNISIPILLPESMFPLVFNIESSELSITPNTAKYPSENLPVEGGASIWRTGKQAFYYKRTLSYDEYRLLPANDNGTKTFTCHFKTNKADSASTVYVTNEYFNMGSGAFTNYTMYYFNTVRFSNPRAAADTNVDCTFNIDSRDNANPRVITVTLDGLVPRNNTGWTTLDAAAGEYSYSFTNTGSKAVTFQLKTLGAGQHNGSYSVTLNSGGYREKVRAESDYQNVDQVLTVDRQLTVTSNNQGVTTNNPSRTYTWSGEDGGTVTVSFSNIRSKTNNSYLELADNSTFTISSSDRTITSIALTFTSQWVNLTTYQTGRAVTATGYTQTDNGASGTWTGRSSSVTFNTGDPDGGGISSWWSTEYFYTRLSAITVTYEYTHTEMILVND